MDIAADLEIQKIKEALRAKLASLSANGEFTRHYLDVRNLVDHWDFATDEMFSVTPFYHELHKFKRGRRLKLTGLDQAWAKGAYAFGFSHDNRLLLTAHPYNKLGAQTGVECKVHYHPDTRGDKMQIDYETSIQYPLSQHKTRPLSVGLLAWISDDTQVDVIVGGEDAYSVAVYGYAGGRVEKVECFAQGWNGQSQYDFIYHEAGDLERIMIGPQLWWSAKK